MDLIENEVQVRMKLCAARMASLREENKLSMEEMAKAIKVSQASISRFENGTRTPELKVLIKLSQKFNVSLEWLTGGDVVTSENALIDYYKGMAPDSRQILMKYATFLYENDKRSGKVGSKE